MKKYLIGILLGLFVIYFGIKIGMVLTLNFGEAYKENKDIINSFEVKEIKNIENKDVNNYVNINDLKIRNDFQNFTNITNGYKLNDETYFTISIDNNMLEYLKNNISEKDNKGFVEFLEKNNIESDIELYRFLNRYGDATSTVFNSFSKIKSNYYVQYIISIMGNQINSLTEIKGDFTGYIMHCKNNNVVVLNINDKTYYLYFYNTEYFNIEYIYELVSTIQI